MGNAIIPFDQEYFCTQNGAKPDSIGVYLKCGLAQGLNPTRFFNTRWYAWQNPDWSDQHDNPYLHYLELGCAQARDPSPLVDMHRFMTQTGGKITAKDAYQRILDGFRAPVLGVYETLEDVCAYQKKFVSQIRVTRHKTTLAQAPRRYLVVLQTGRGSIHKEWFNNQDRNWDLLVNYYDAHGFDPMFGEYVFCQMGTKFTAMHNFYQHYQDLLLQYDHILFLDDDIRVSVDDLNALFQSVSKNNLDLAQMALSESSHCVWPALFHAPGAPALRLTNAVEIMMPVLSRRALQAIGPLLGESISGFGLDLLWGKLVADYGGRIGVLNDIIAAHESEIDDKAGAYYGFMRANMINPKAELWRLIEHFSLDTNIG
ncbi:MAG: hypothetical protein L3J33_00110 [Rhodobacteraceae bacterium]|nr:hypothetical protein [Paracoccaceae bacterium]